MRSHWRTFLAELSVEGDESPLPKFVIASWLQRRARGLGMRGPLKTGAVTQIQRFNSALDLSVHFHALVLDGVYSFPAGKAPVFHPTPAPRDDEIARWRAYWVRTTCLRGIGLSPATSHDDPDGALQATPTSGETSNAIRATIQACARLSGPARVTTPAIALRQLTCARAETLVARTAASARAALERHPNKEES